MEVVESQHNAPALRQQLQQLPPSVAAPLHSLKQLSEWRTGDNPLQRCYVPALKHALPRSPLPGCKRGASRPLVLHCHDLAGGYTCDTDAQHGGRAFHSYAFQCWARVDLLVYFSHARVAVPPNMWQLAAHRNGVRVLANLCTEWEEGERENVRLLYGEQGRGAFAPSSLACSAASSSSAAASQEPPLEDWQRYAQQMVALAVEYDFDGWFLNIEAALPKDALQPNAAEEDSSSSPSSLSSSAESATAPLPAIPPHSVVRLTQFLSYLTAAMHAARPDSLVLWYDSVRASDGALAWQSRLNEDNEPFWNSCDAIFTDYHWQREWPTLSAERADKHAATHASSTALITSSNTRTPPATSSLVGRHRVFTGVDLWGRGSWGGGGFDALRAVKVAWREAGTSLALFAPAWTLEAEGRGESRDDFVRCERKLWLGAQGSSDDQEQEQQDHPSDDGAVDLSAPSSSLLQPSQQHPPQRSIASIVPRHRQPLHAMVHTFSTGNGKHFFLAGKPVAKGECLARQRQQDDVVANSSNAKDASCEWYNLALQDSQVVLAEALLCDGVIHRAVPLTPPSAPQQAAAATLRGQACITHEAAYEGGCCFQVNLEVEPAATSSLPSAFTPAASVPASLVFDCFEFGPRAESEEDEEAAPHVWEISFVWWRSNAAWSVALSIEQMEESAVANGSLAPATTPLLVSPTAAELVQSAVGSWTTVRGTIPARFDSVQFGCRIRVQVTCLDAQLATQLSAQCDAQTVRIGQVCLQKFPARQPTPASDALVPVGSQSSVLPPAIRVQSFPYRGDRHSREDEDLQAAAFHFRWDDDAAQLSTGNRSSNKCAREPSAVCWDVFINGRWQARLLQPQYVLDCLSPLQLARVFSASSSVSSSASSAVPATPTLPSSDFRFTVRTSWSDGARDAVGSGRSIFVAWPQPCCSSS